MHIHVFCCAFYIMTTKSGCLQHIFGLWFVWVCGGGEGVCVFFHLGTTKEDEEGANT